MLILCSLYLVIEPQNIDNINKTRILSTFVYTKYIDNIDNINKTRVSSTFLSKRALNTGFVDNEC